MMNFSSVKRYRNKLVQKGLKYLEEVMNNYAIDPADLYQEACTFEQVDTGQWTKPVARI